MNFKEALIAHLHGEKVEVRAAQMDVPWKDFAQYHGQCYLAQVFESDFGGACEYRLAPRTIFVNGVEVPAPESVAPDHLWKYFVPDVSSKSLYAERCNRDAEEMARELALNIVYLTPSDAIARAKAMLLTSDNQQELSVSQLADKMAERRGYICQSVTGSRDGDTVTYTIECVRPDKSDA